MVDTPKKTLTTLHVIHSLAWQREGPFTFDMQRAQILDLIARVMQTSHPTEPPQPILLGGETILIRDVAAISNQLLLSLVSGAQAGHFSIGPWYVQLDGLLANGEAFIRSLLLGHTDHQLYGIPAPSIAPMPDDFQTNQQLPQILTGFEIDTLFVRTERPPLPIPFLWRAPDESTILVITYQIAADITAVVDAQKPYQPDGPFVWVHDVTSDDPHLSSDSTADNITLNATTLAQLTEAIRERLPDQFRPVLHDALYLRPLSERTGRYSARISLKQDIIRLSMQLSHHAEPLLALSMTFGNLAFAHIQTELLAHCWRLLLQNMTPQIFSGAIDDAGYEEIRMRNRQVEDNARRVTERALNGLSGKIQDTKKRTTLSETYITVWNAHGHDVTQVVKAELELPDKMHPQVLLTPSGDEIPFTWDAQRYQLDFRAAVDAVGYCVYTLKLSREKTAEYNQNRAVAGRAIGTASGESLGLVNGRLEWTFANSTISDLLTYFDGGDAGTIWQYEEPTSDVVMKGNIVDVIQVEATPTYQRLLFRNRMRIAPKLKSNQERVRGLRVLDLATTATYYNGIAGVHFETHFTNTAEDHRLRAHIRTGINATKVMTDTAFKLIEHDLSAQQSGGDLPLQSVVVIQDDKRALAIITRGLLAVDPIREDGQITLALTLLRAVGQINDEVPSETAQMAGDFTTEFMILPLKADYDTTELLRTAMTYQAPLYALQYAEKPDQAQLQYMGLDSPHTVMTALKAPQTGDGLIIRLCNTSGETDIVTLKPHELPRTVAQVNLKEEHIKDLEITDGAVTLMMAPHQIMTVLLQF